MEKHVVKQVSHGGRTVNLLAYQLVIDTTKAARVRLSTAILMHRVCVTSTHLMSPQYGLGRGITADVMITVPEPCAEAALACIKAYKVSLPTQPHTNSTGV